MDVKVDMGFLKALMGLFSSDAIDRSQEVSVSCEEVPGCLLIPLSLFFFFWGGGGGGRGSLLHLHRFESCREVCYTSFYFDNSYGMVIRLLLVTSYSIAHGILHSSLFSSIFTKHKKLFFCGYPSRYPS